MTQSNFLKQNPIAKMEMGTVTDSKKLCLRRLLSYVSWSRDTFMRDEIRHMYIYV